MDAKRKLQEDIENAKKWKPTSHVAEIIVTTREGAVFNFKFNMNDQALRQLLLGTELCLIGDDIRHHFINSSNTIQYVRVIK